MVALEVPDRGLAGGPTFHPAPDPFARLAARALVYGHRPATPVLLPAVAHLTLARLFGRFLL